jgi:hypothetical protein
VDSYTKRTVAAGGAAVLVACASVVGFDEVQYGSGADGGTSPVDGSSAEVVDVAAAPTCVGPDACVFRPGEDNPGAVVTDDTNVIWAISGSGGNSEVRSCPVAGCDSSGPATVTRLSSPVDSMTFLNGTLCLLSSAGLQELASSDGGTVPLIGLSGPQGLSTDGAYLMWSQAGTSFVCIPNNCNSDFFDVGGAGATRFVGSSGQAWFAWPQDGGSVAMCTTASCRTPATTTPVATGEGTITGLAVGSTHVVWSIGGSPNQIRATTRAPSSGVMTLATASPVLDIAIRGDTVVWLTSSGEVEWADVTKAGKTTIATGLASPVHLALTKGFVFVTSSSGRIYRVPI